MAEPLALEVQHFLDCVRLRRRRRAATAATACASCACSRPSTSRWPRAARRSPRAWRSSAMPHGDGTGHGRQPARARRTCAGRHVRRGRRRSATTSRCGHAGWSSSPARVHRRRRGPRQPHHDLRGSHARRRRAWSPTSPSSASGPSSSPRSTAKKAELPGVVVGAGTQHRQPHGPHGRLRPSASAASSATTPASASGARIGDDVVVGRSVTVENDTTIGSRTKIQSGAYVTAYVTIEEDVLHRPDGRDHERQLHGPHREALRRAQGRDDPPRRARRRGRAHPARRSRSARRRSSPPAPSSPATCPPARVVMGVPAKRRARRPADELLENQ